MMKFFYYSLFILQPVAYLHINITFGLFFYFCYNPSTAMAESFFEIAHEIILGLYFYISLHKIRINKAE